jgi:hypothetical protein
MRFEYSVLNPGTVASLNIGRLEKHILELRVPATFVVLTLEKAYSEPATINALK